MLVHDLWPEIKALAAALLAPKRLTGEQAVAIINPLKLTLAKYRMRKGIRITRVTQVLSKEQG
jgi:hypothetical protein